MCSKVIFVLELRGTSPFLRDVRETALDSLESFNQTDEGYAGNGNSSNPFMSIMELTLATCEAAAHAQRLLLNIAWLPSSALASQHPQNIKKQQMVSLRLLINPTVTGQKITKL